MMIKLRLMIISLLVNFFIPFISSAQMVWEKGNDRILLIGKTLELVHNNSKVVEITAFAFNFVQPDSILVDHIKPDTLFLKMIFSEKDGFNADFPRELMLTINHTNNTFHFYAGHRAFRHITIIMKDKDEHYFGLIEKLYPHNSKNPDLRGNVVDVDVYGNGSDEYAENYASAYSAFYMSSAGYGSFFDTFARGRYHLAINGITEIYHQTQTMDWYIFCGEDGKAIHKEYYQVIGKPKYVPIWACGPIFWRDQNNGGKDEVLNDINKFTELKIPLTACWIDRPFSNGSHEWSKMDFNEKFSEPGKWIKTINEKYGMQLMTWVGPLTMADKDFPGLLPGHVSYIDLTDPAALDEFGKRLNTNLYMNGVRGHKMDRADENFPLTAPWHGPVPQSESRNKYIYLYSKVINDFLTKAHGKNNFNFARSAFHRCQPHLSAVWGGDSRTNWHGMAGNQANAIRCGFLGFPIWGGDTGGYLGEGRIDQDLYIRWLQLGVWNGMFETKIDGSGGSGEDRPPWKYSAQLQKVFRDVCELRMELLPYIYSCANTSYENGVMMKPLSYVFLSDTNTCQIWDEFVFGDAFLVAPVLAKNNSRTIYLPEGTWYDFNDPSVEFKGPVSIKRDVPLTVTPVFTKANSIFITGQIYQGNSKLWTGDLDKEKRIRIHLYPGRINEQYAFTYVDYPDNDAEKKMILNHLPDKILFTSEPLSTISEIVLKCTEKPIKILLNGRKIDFEYNGKTKISTVKADKNKQIDLQVFN